MDKGSDRAGTPGRKFADIIERIEYFRNYKGLNKSRFSAEIGMKPQTYNNFIGSQGSKPNVELIHGVVTRFGVNPGWLLTGKGSMLAEPAGQGRGEPAARGVTEAAQVAERSAAYLAEQAETLRELRQQVQLMEPRLRELEQRVRQTERAAHPALERLEGVLQRYLRSDPRAAEEEIGDFTARVEEKLAGR